MLADAMQSAHLAMLRQFKKAGRGGWDDGEVCDTLRALKRASARAGAGRYILSRLFSCTSNVEGLIMIFKAFRRFVITAALVCAAYASAQTATTQRAATINLTNGGFEKKLDGWDNDQDNNMSAVASVAAHQGGFGLRVTDDDDAKGASLATAKFVATPGKNYRCTFWARLVREGHAAVYLQFYDATGKLLTRGTDKTDIHARVQGTEWQSYTLNGIAPPTAATVRLWIHTGNTGRPQADFDDITFTEE